MHLPAYRSSCLSFFKNSNFDCDMIRKNTVNMQYILHFKFFKFTGVQT